MLKIVLDTNVFLVSVASHLKYYWIFEKLVNNEYEFYVTNEILTEYLEIITSRYGLTSSESKLDFLLLLPNVHLVNPYYHWHLIENDKDDNKFVDCAISSNADYIVTEDRHFDVLKNLEFPKVKVINIAQFKELF
jgi:putative PIN family toxin of toxin-antitoxin system